MAPCPGGAGVHARWTARALAGAFLDLAIVYAFLCAAAAASAASAILALLRLRLPCTCSRPHLPCLFAFLFRYPSRVLESLLLSLRSRFPFVVDPDDGSQEEGEDEDESVDEEEEEVNLKREADEGNDVSALQQELDKERSAAASAAEEAMAMILRLQKEKSSLEMEVRQQRRTSDERCVFYEDEVEELKDILLMRERENRSLQKDVESYRRLLGLSVDDDEEEEMMTPRNYFGEGDPSSSRSVDNNSVFSFKKQLVRQQVSPIRVGHVKDGNENSPALQSLGEVPVVGSKLGADSCEDDGTETVVILPLSAQSLNLPQSARCLDLPQSARCLDLPQSARCLDKGGDVEVNAAAGMKAMEELTADEFQEVDSWRLDKAYHDFMASDNDANIFDVHVVDDICLSTEGPSPPPRRRHEPPCSSAATPPRAALLLRPDAAASCPAPPPRRLDGRRPDACPSSSLHDARPRLGLPWVRRRPSRRTDQPTDPLAPPPTCPTAAILRRRRPCLPARTEDSFASSLLLHGDTSTGGGSTAHRRLLVGVLLSSPARQVQPLRC